MKDIDNPRFKHGGGEIPFKGKVNIKEGALRFYKGPCPLPGVTHSYKITVLALSADNNILGQGSAVKRFTTKRLRK